MQKNPITLPFRRSIAAFANGRAGAHGLVPFDDMEARHGGRSQIAI